MKDIIKQLDNVTLDTIYNSHDGWLIEMLLLQVHKTIPHKREFRTYLTPQELNAVLDSFAMKLLTETIDFNKDLGDVDSEYAASNKIFYSDENDHYETIIKVSFNSKNQNKGNGIYIQLYTVSSEQALSNDIFKKLTEKPKATTNKKVGFISLQGNYWDMEEVEITDIPIINFDLNYNDDFKHKEVTDLVNSNKHGLILLGGLAGSGKTNYIRWLMANSNKKFVYMPASQISLMSSPSFISFALSELKDCVLLMEDCEEALIDRSAMKGGEVQTILNLSDGIIGSALNLTIIGTYNTKDNIDKALFRKGRLLHMYEFDGLIAKKATELSKMLGFNNVYTTKQPLSEVYNPEANKIEKDVNAPFGFKIGG